MNRLFSILTFLALLCCCVMARAEVVVGAERLPEYLPLLRDSRVALLSNHTGLVNGGKEHTLDMLLRNGVNVTAIFSPEHGFRGDADAGSHVKNSVDAKTGIPIASLYNGKDSSPSPETMDRFDVILCDLQDVGVRYYTYYVTMMKLMDAAARSGKRFIVLDRPNPVAMMVDGPVLDMSLKSGVGALPVPVAHGMTLGELALMINGECWLPSAKKVDLTVIPCAGYTRSTRYRLPVNPSPNLKSMKAIYLYPSTCYFEGTVMSLGRGTEMPFEIYGHPSMKNAPFSFTPRSMPGAKNPPLNGRLCHGKDLRGLDDDSIIARGVDLSYVIDAYRSMPPALQPKFFTSFFNLLIGDRRVAPMIREGKSAAEIRALWQDDIKAFRARREPYLLYPEK
ncbi:MAG: DUF1343 domain-containing protein [Muribaculaceae bacterium]|nr:DUF1343 domain-containing protein [Muribaculaceae bacterium]